MPRLTPRFRSPFLQALWSTAIMAALGLAVRFIWGGHDPEMRSWTFVALAPLMGVTTYLQATGRNRLLGAGLVGLGVAALLFWTLVLVSGRIPITGRSDYAYITIVFAFPVAAIGYGYWQLRKRADTPRASLPS